MCVREKEVRVYRFTHTHVQARENRQLTLSVLLSNSPAFIVYIFMEEMCACRVREVGTCKVGSLLKACWLWELDSGSQA